VKEYYYKMMQHKLFFVTKSNTMTADVNLGMRITAVPKTSRKRFLTLNKVKSLKCKGDALNFFLKEKGCFFLKKIMKQKISPE